MAGKQSSEVKRRTASTRKTTTTRKSSAGKKRNTSGKSANTKVSRMQVSEYTEPVGDEIKLIIILAVSILILLSVFGLGGRVGDKAAYLFFGLFGFVAYALPFLLFIGSAFHISNRGSRLARIKLTAIEPTATAAASKCLSSRMLAPKIAGSEARNEYLTA